MAATTMTEVEQPKVQNQTTWEIIGRMRRYYKTTGKKARYSMRPMERLAYKERFRREKRHFYACRKGKNATFLALAEINTTVENQTFLTAWVIGKQWSGKSEIAMTLAKRLKREEEAKGRKPQIFVCFSPDEVMGIVHRTKPGDIILMDESPYESGMGSGTTLKALLNVVHVTRVREVSFIFVTPALEDWKKRIQTDLIFETCGKDLENRITRCIIYDGIWQQCHGWGYVKLHTDDKFRDAYEKRKKENADELAFYGGVVSTKASEDRLERDVAMVVQKVQEARKAGRIIKPFKTEILPYMQKVGVAGDTTYQESVLSEAVQVLRGELAPPMPPAGAPPQLVEVEETAARTSSGRITSGGVTFVPIEIKENLNNESILATLPIIYKEWQQSRKLPTMRKFQKKHFNVWRDYYLQNNQTAGDHIAANYGVSPSVLTNKYRAGGWLAIAQEELLGYLLEEAARRQHFPTFNRLGGEGEVDLINEDGKIGVSVKMRSRRHTPSASWLSRDELLLLKDPSKQLLLYYVYYDRENCYETLWEVHSA